MNYRIVPALFLVLTVLSGCERKISEEEIRLTEELRELRKEYGKKDDEARRLRDKFYEDERLIRALDYEQKKEVEISQNSQQVRDYLASLERSHELITRDLENWRKATRESFVGMKIPAITKTSGETLQNLTVKEVNDNGIVVSQVDNTAITIPYIELDAGSRQRFVHEDTILSETHSK